MDNNSIPTVKQNTLENNIKLFIDTNNDYLKSNLDQTEQLLKSFRNQKITLIEQKQIWKNLWELFMNFIPNKNNQYIYQSVIMEVKNLVEKEENIILFKAIQDEANTSCYGSFWNKVITESNFSEKTQEYIDFNKISTYSLFLKDTKLSDITKSKFINQQIAKNELLFIVNNYDTVDELLSEETRKDLVEKIQKKYSEWIIYKTLLIWEFYNLNEEIQKSFIYNISLELIKIDEFYDYNIVNPPLVSGYDLEETITTINFDEEVNPNDEDVIDQYIWFWEYKYDKENENFYKEDENWKIVYEISLDDARSEVQQSRFETFEFDLWNRFDLNNKDLFKEEYSNYRNSVDIKYDKLNGLDENKSFDEYIWDYISDKTNHQNIERIKHRKIKHSLSLISRIINTSIIKNQDE